jgi:hypothetical protein
MGLGKRDWTVFPPLHGIRIRRLGYGAVDTSLTFAGIPSASGITQRDDRIDS